MTVLKHELSRGKISLLIWAGAITFLLCVSVFLFPEMRGEMEEVGKMFSEMGSFTAAFGMDKLDFGTLTGYYATECGNVLGLGGAFFASLSAVSALSKEENYKTAEFLFSHPISRARVVGEKLLAVILSVTALNVCVYAASVLSVIAIGESVPWTEVNLLHLSYYIMQIEIACVCFCISAFAGKGSAGIGLGVAAIMYFLNIIANITDSAGFLKYVTPFGYCDGASVVSDKAIDGVKIAIGLAVSAISVALAFFKYTKKDIR